VSAKRRSTFLNNHREVIAAMDFFTVHTLTFGILHCFFVIGHDRRRIIHCNVTMHPSSAWILQQLREAVLDRRFAEFWPLSTNGARIFSTPDAGTVSWRLAVGAFWTGSQGYRGRRAPG
jgi:hypothetical protein